MLPEGRLLGHYRVVHHIGSGGMGEVYLAEDTRINRQVAIKVVRNEAEPYPATTQDTAHIFKREMRAITMLDHPNILPLFDFGDEKDGNMILTYMVMPLREEGSLVDWLQKRGTNQKLTQDEVAYFVLQAAEALQNAHDHHIIHQDVKPSNFLIRSRSGHMLPDLLLTDFGIAKITTATATASQSIRGTPTFMAPEQWEGHPQPATDQYALGVMAYLLLTGHPPFSGSMGQVMHEHLMVQPQPPSRLNPAISPTLDAVFLRALEKQPDRRFPSILAFAQAFQQALQSIGDQDSTVIAPQTPQPVPPPLPVTPMRYPAKLEKSAPIAPADNLNPSYVPIPPGSSARDRSKRSKLRIPLVMTIVLLIIVSIFLQFFLNNAVNNAIVPNNANANATAQATATAQVTANNPYPSYLSGEGTLAFVDPLSQADHWSASTGEACQFTNGAYHVIQKLPGYFMHCDASGTYSNFAFEVQLIIVKGDCGGIVFRYDQAIGHFYKFAICRDGTYWVLKYMSNTGSDTEVLQNGTSSAIKSGLDQQTKIAIVASSNTLAFYANEQQIAFKQESSYASGSIALIAEPIGDQATDVAYSNARLWTL